MSLKIKASVLPHPFDRTQEWSVAKYGVSLLINNHSLIHGMKDGISLDVEDNNGEFVGLGIYEKLSNTCFYWSDIKLAKNIALPKFVAHNGISDIRKLQNWGFTVDESYLMWDTQIMAHILDSSRKVYGLKKLVKEDFGVEYPSYQDICGKKGEKNLSQFPIQPVAEYNACDTYWTYRLYQEQRRKQTLFSEEGSSREQDYFDILEKPCTSIFKDMEERGIRIDLSYLTKLKTNLEEQKCPIENNIKNDLGSINLDSPKQLLKALNEKEICPQWKGKPSTDKRALEYHKDNPIIQRLLKYSEVSTLLSSFVYPYLERNTEIVHPYFNQCGTRTGRVSCSNPNLLQIPRRTENGKLLRRMFIPREGRVFGDCDFGYIEPTVLAHLSQDKTMCEMFNKRINFHDFTRDKMRIDREKAKVLNLSVGYRATFKSVSQQLSCSEEEAQKEIKDWWNMFPGLFDWENRLIYESKKSGYCTTLMGRRIKIDGLDNPNSYKREHAQRQLINNIAQGSAAEIMKRAMIEVAKLPVYVLVQVYDELLFEMSSKNIDLLHHVREVMENCTKLDVPLVVEAKLGRNWEECH